MMRVVALLVAAALSLGASAAEIEFVDNGYRNLVVSISPDIPSDDGQAIVDGIKVLTFESLVILAGVLNSSFTVLDQPRKCHALHGNEATGLHCSGPNPHPRVLDGNRGHDAIV